MNKKIKVFMGDLTHTTTTTLSSDTIPINLGFIAEYCKSKLNGKAEFVLFKYPEDLIEALKHEKPDILTLSSYPWNRYLSLKVMEFYDKIHEDHINVLGGPNFPLNNIEFYRKNPQLNFYIPGEGEIPFLELCSKVIDDGANNVKKARAPIKGTVSLKNNELLSKDLFVNLDNLNEIPSPYLSGILDKFFDPKLNPFIQTNRGCPFKCAFCHTGSNPAFKKVRMFDLERIRDELSYIAEKSKNSSKSLLIADTNFGMYRRDLDICSHISRLRNEFGFPQHVVSDFGKENRTNVMACFKELNKNKKGAYISIAVQSTDSQVLDNVRRKHFDEKEYFDFVNAAHELNSAVLSEVIIPLPGETKESHLNTLKVLIKAKIDLIIPYTLLLLESTEMKSLDYKNKFGFQVKYRMVPTNYGTYDGIRAMETEEAVVSTNDMSFSEYIELRALHLLMKTFFFEGTFDSLIKFAELHNINLEKWIMECNNQLPNADPKLRAVFDDFKTAMTTELWDSEEEMLGFFQKEENYRKLLTGELGGNLLQIYSSRILSSEYISMLDFLTSNLSKLSTDVNKSKLELFEVVRFLKLKNSNAFDIALLEDKNSNLFSYDIIEWMKHKGLPLEEFKSERMYEFYHTEEQKKRIKSLIEQYGYGDQEIGKILTRESITTFFRTVKIKE